ncbi:MAG: endonuclease/exonuclease/phosphatase family protein [Rubrivivax sp.]|nr:endonuclease/exonuclease/phosphatase family protein [Rubrivivax sp.]
MSGARVFLCVLLWLACAPAQAAGPAPLNAATYNLRLNLSEDGANAWPQRKEAVKALIRYHEFDLLGTQEGMPEQIRDLEEMTEFARVGVGRDDGQSAGEHAAIFYRRARFERLATGHFWLSATPDVPSIGWDGRCCKRIASWVKLSDRTSGKTFFVFNAHFDHEGVAARRESALLMLRKIAEIAGGQPVICMGDFNSTPGMDAIRTFGGALRDARAASETPPYGPLGTFNDFKLDAPMLERIDYVFVGPRWRVLKYGVLSDSLDRRYPSDHHPVAVRLVLD